MDRTIPLATLVFVVSALGFAENWSGVLVDSKCYDSYEKSNLNPFDPDTAVNHDVDLEIRSCRPNTHTKSFAVIEESGVRVKLDSAGNAKAAELVGKAPKSSHLAVAVTGEISKDAVKVDSISLLR